MSKKLKKLKKPIFSISIAEFDIDIGNTLTKRFPDFKFEKYNYQSLANLVIPDGAHIHKSDHTYLVLDCAGEKGFPSETCEESYVFGIGIFVCIHDETVRRGAKQSSILLLSKLPYFPLYLPLLKTTLTKYMLNPNVSHIKTLYKALNENLQKGNQLKLWGETIPLNIPRYEVDEFPGASLVELVKLFKMDTMLLWYAMLQRSRIFVIGQPAGKVSNCVISTPLLVQPLKGYTGFLVPYVALTDVHLIEKPSFIAGSTNPIFSMRPEWCDFVASFATGTVTQNKEEKIKITGSDREHIKNVLSGVNDNKSESWVREQFTEYTEKFLQSWANGNPKSSHKKYLPNFIKTELFEGYIQELSNRITQLKPEEKKSPKDFIGMLSDENEELGALEKTKTLYTLHGNLVNLTAIEEACDVEGVKIMSKFLGEKSAQVRKYATGVISQLSLCVKGQLSVMSGSILEQIVALLDDKMSNVQNAACYCLMKISSLYIGADSLVERGVHLKFKEMIEKSTDLKLKSTAAQALVQIYNFLPNIEKVDIGGFTKEFESIDPKYVSNLIKLFDLYERELPKRIEPSNEFKKHLTGLKSDNSENRVLATQYLLTDLVSKPQMIQELILTDSLDIIFENEKLNPPDHKLSQLCVDVLVIAVDTFAGREEIIKNRFINRALTQLRTTNDPLYIFYILRFLEVASQHKNTAEIIVQNDGLKIAVQTVLKHISRPMFNTLTLPGLGIIKYLYLSLPEKKSEFFEHAKTLEPFFVHPTKRFVSQPSHDREIQDSLLKIIKLAEFNMDEVMKNSLKRESLEKKFTEYHGSDKKEKFGILFSENSLLKNHTLEQLVPKMSEKRKNEVKEFIEFMKAPFEGETGLD
ncbi:arf3-interacting protein [Anaeramoeba flamelloides]|uniref:Arf3-interacting protein n=1 Tax=Anaeramoeba flamelloides TaxID=1746091 RepID=A0AAV7YC06_9EUKA|nr:arf3-interacting protein [Anaeramoeba flamelloides]KAJ6232197.1 arf3-interacting protein [Anaeramoeba flamelloides]